jgi:hypothetical protein
MGNPDDRQSETSMAGVVDRNITVFLARKQAGEKAKKLQTV